MKYFLNHKLVQTFSHFTDALKAYILVFLFLLMSSSVLAEEGGDGEALGPVLERQSYIYITPFEQTIQNMPAPWSPSIAPILEESINGQDESSNELFDDQETGITLPEIEPSDTEKTDIVQFEAITPDMDESEVEFELETEEQGAELDAKGTLTDADALTEIDVQIETEHTDALLPLEESDSSPNVLPSEIMPIDVHPKPAQIAILIDDLGYNRHGMESSLILPIEVALAILPETPFAFKTAVTAQEQQRITLLHAPMENQRGLALGPGGLYAKMTEQELKDTLQKDIDGLPGIQGVNNHMGSLLTTKQQSMTWVMEVLKDRSLFFIDSLTSRDSVAKETAQEHGLKTVSREVFLDNIRTEKAIDVQFSRLIKLARRDGSALAIGHPYAETTAYLKKRLSSLNQDGVTLVPLSKVLLLPSDSDN